MAVMQHLRNHNEHRRRPYGAFALGALILVLATGCSDAGGDARTVLVVGLEGAEPTREIAAGARKAGKEAGDTRVRVLAVKEPSQLASAVERRLQDHDVEVVAAAGAETAALLSPLGREFPESTFVLFGRDEPPQSPPGARVVRFSRKQQGFVLGHLAALATTSGATRTNPANRIGLLGRTGEAVAAALEDSYRLGARSVDPDIHIDVAYVERNAGGDAVYDATHELVEAGADLILACAGEANAQIIQAVRESHGYVLLADDGTSRRGRGTVLAAVVTDRARATENAVGAVLAVPAPPDVRGRFGFAGGYLDFRPATPLYRRVLPKQVRDAQDELVRRLTDGELTLDR